MRQWTWKSNSLKLLHYGEEELQIPPPQTKTIMVKMSFQMARLALLWKRHRGQTMAGRKTERALQQEAKHTVLNKTGLPSNGLVSAGITSQEGT